MAYTKIHAIKATVDKAIDYICNPDKTDEQIYVSSYACAPETAAIDFKYTLDHCRENSPNKAYHLIQAFAPGEVSYEEAHRIGKELADKVLEGKSSYVEADLMQKLMSLLSWVFQVEPFCSDCHSLYFLPRSPPGMMMERLCSLHSSSLSFRMW